VQNSEYEKLLKKINLKLPLKCYIPNFLIAEIKTFFKTSQIYKSN
jgi:hypothetical protein